MSDNGSFEEVQRFLTLDVTQFEFARSAVQPRIAPGESIEDVFIGSAYLGKRRAGLFGRSGGTSDLQFVLSMFTWWPNKSKGRPRRWFQPASNRSGTAR